MNYLIVFPRDDEEELENEEIRNILKTGSRTSFILNAYKHSEIDCKSIN